MKATKSADTNALVNVYVSVALSCGVTSCVTAVAFTWKTVSFRCFHYSIIVFLLGLSDGCIAMVLLFRYWMHECLGFDFEDYSYITCRMADAIGFMCITTSVWLMTLFALERCMNRLQTNAHKRFFNNVTILKFFVVIECVNAGGFILKSYSKVYVDKMIKTRETTLTRCRTNDMQFTSDVCYGIVSLFIPILIIGASLTLIIIKSGKNEARHLSKNDARLEKLDSIKEFAGFAFVYFTALLISFSFDIASSKHHYIMSATSRNLISTLGLTGAQCGLAFHIRFWRRFRKEMSKQRRQGKSAFKVGSRTSPLPGELTTEGPFSIGPTKRIPVSNQSKQENVTVRSSSDTSVSSTVDGATPNLENETVDIREKIPVCARSHDSDLPDKHQRKVSILSHFKIQKKSKLGRARIGSYDEYPDSPQLSEPETESDAYPIWTPPKESRFRRMSSTIKETIAQLKASPTIKTYDDSKPEKNYLVDLKNLRRSATAGTYYDIFKQAMDESNTTSPTSALKRPSTKQLSRTSSNQRVKWQDTHENMKSTVSSSRKSRGSSVFGGGKVSISRLSELISSENILKFKNSPRPESSKDIDLKDNVDDKT